MSNSRRNFLLRSSRLLASTLVVGGATSLCGCIGRRSADLSDNRDGHFIGRLGLADGRFQKPRALAIDHNDELYVVDKTGRIQVFATDGTFLRKWQTPEIANGKPTGISVMNDGTIAVADTHYFRILFYTPQGELLKDRTLGGSFGPERGQMAFVTDCIQAPDGTYFVSEYGQFDRIQKYSPQGEFIHWFGEHGDGELQFARPQSICLDERQRLWVADSCNHRIRVFDWTGDEPRLELSFGSNGKAPGQFRYPYGILLGNDDSIYVAEYGGHRVQKLQRDGTFIESRGTPGRDAGQMNAPWSVAMSSSGQLFVVESGNNRIQRFDA